MAEQVALKAEPLAVEAGLGTVAAVLLLEVSSSAIAVVVAYRMVTAAALTLLAVAERR